MFESKDKFPLDIENTQEKCTPYMLAVLRENFRIADALIETGWCNKYHANKDRMTVLDIVGKYNIKSCQRYLIADKEKEGERDTNRKKRMEMLKSVQKQKSS